jgi:hypothetical protein
MMLDNSGETLYKFGGGHAIQVAISDGVANPYLLKVRLIRTLHHLPFGWPGSRGRLAGATRHRRLGVHGPGPKLFLHKIDAGFL